MRDRLALRRPSSNKLSFRHTFAGYVLRSMPPTQVRSRDGSAGGSLQTNGSFPRTVTPPCRHLGRIWQTTGEYIITGRDFRRVLYHSETFCGAVKAGSTLVHGSCPYVRLSQLASRFIAPFLGPARCQAFSCDDAKCSALSPIAPRRC